MEAMLSCWLHQLQEFGGPEVEKTDALKGSNGSLKSGQLQAPPSAMAGKSPESSVSAVKKKGVPDPKARYNVSQEERAHLSVYFSTKCPSVPCFEISSRLGMCSERNLRRDSNDLIPPPGPVALRYAFRDGDTRRGDSCCPDGRVPRL